MDGMGYTIYKIYDLC